MEATHRVLVVDDSEVDRENIRRLLAPDYSVFEAASGSEGLGLCEKERVDCVLLDHRLPDVEGIEMLHDLVERELPVLMLTGQGNEALAVEAMKRGALDYLVKGQLQKAGLRRSVKNALETSGMRQQIARQEAELRQYVKELDEQRESLQRSNQRLMESEARLRVVFEQLPALAWTADRELVLTSLAGEVARRTEAPPWGSRVERLFGGGAPTDAHMQALDGNSAHFEVTLADRVYDAHVEPLMTDGDVSGVIGVALDVSRARVLEQQLRHSQKMDSLGQLAGGIAHDLNNVLTVISSFAQFVKDGLHPQEQAYGDINEVLRAASSAENLVRQLLTFSRQRPSQPRVVDVGELTTNVTPMLRRLLGETFKLEVSIPDAPHTVYADAGSLEQVLVNLVVNARDAMPEGGTVTVEILREMVGNEPCLDLEPGAYVVLAVKDNGVGIGPDVVERIFEPFFTTKDQGKGTGLGLSTCYGIVQQARGMILVETEVGAGTVFRTYLPESSGVPETERRPSAPPAAAGSETVLVLEDDPQVRSLIARVLTSHGYQVVETESAKSAQLAAERTSKDHFALMVADVAVPDGVGSEVARDLKKLHPRMEVLFVSGHGGGALRARGVSEEDTVLHKPFTAGELAKIVRKCLDRRSRDV